MLRRYNQHEGAILMRLSAPGGREQLDKCLAALSDPEKVGPLAPLFTFKETNALHDFLSAPREKLFAWADENELYVAGKIATDSLQFFLKQERNFGFTPNVVERNWSKIIPPDEQPVMLERLKKLCTTWGFELIDGRPEEQ